MSQKFYVKSTQVDGIKIPILKIIKLGTIFIRILPPPYRYGGGYKNCESYEIGGPPLRGSPRAPLEENSKIINIIEIIEFIKFISFIHSASWRRLPTTLRQGQPCC